MPKRIKGKSCTKRNGSIKSILCCTKEGCRKNYGAMKNENSN